MLKVGIIGAGNITSLRHIPALRRSGRVEIHGILDRRAEKSEGVARRLQISNHGSSFDDPWFREVSAVTIGVPPHAHFESCKEALERGKHVLLEKPMAMSLAEGEELKALALRKGVILTVVQNFQFSRSALALKRLIADGKLGELRSFFCFQMSTKDRMLPVWHEELPLGLFYDESPHLLYLLGAFGGDLSVEDIVITPSAEGRVTPAVVTANLRAGGLPATLYNNFEAPLSEWHFSIFGTKAVGTIDLFRDILITVPNDGQHLAMDVLRSSINLTGQHLWGVFTAGIRMLRGAHLYGNETVIERFLDAIERGTNPDGITAEDGLRVLKLQHELLNRARTLGAT